MDSEPPRIWLILGDKGGDNRQVEILAEHLRWPFELRRVIPRPEWAYNKPPVRPKLEIFDPASSDRLEPPWPDLVITIGRRPSSAAMWVREQNRGKTRIVLVGKPSGSINPYDLVVASAEQYLPHLRNVMTIGLPLMRVDKARIAEEIEVWLPRLDALPRPWVLILVGGPTGPYNFGPALGQRLAGHARQIVETRGGTAFVITSRRTPQAMVDGLARDLPQSARLFAWGDEAAGNPYAALLGLADAALVTADSISMQTEVARQGLPLSIISVDKAGWAGWDQRRRVLVRRLSGGTFGWASSLLARMGFSMQVRDFEAFQDMLVERGLAVRDRADPPPPTGRVDDDALAVINRIETLMAGRRPQEAASTMRKAS